jgi:hypothetical protein
MSSKNVTKTKLLCALLVLLMLPGCTAVQPNPPPQPAGAARPGKYRILFDASHGETAGNADWIISTSMPDPRGEDPDPRDEDDWTGALSAWGVALHQTGRYELATLPRGERITFSDTPRALDLANFDVFVVPEPNIRFSAAEKRAIVGFVRGGGGLFMIADHDGSDRNRDGVDSPWIWNDLMRANGVAANPFGFVFDTRDIGRDDPRNIPEAAADDPVLRGPFGQVKGSIIRGGTTATLDPSANPSVRGLIYRSGVQAGGAKGTFFLTSAFGDGRVAAWGDSSPIDDGSGAPGEQLFDGWNDAGGSNAILALNATEWLAQAGAEQPTPRPTLAP